MSVRNKWLPRGVEMRNWIDLREIRNFVMLGLLIYLVVRYVFPVFDAVLNFLVIYIEAWGRAFQ